MLCEKVVCFLANVFELISKKFGGILKSPEEGCGKKLCAFLKNCVVNKLSPDLSYTSQAFDFIHPHPSVFAL